MDIKHLKRLIREIITTEYLQEYKKTARENLNKCKTIEEIKTLFEIECYYLARNHSGIMDYKY